MLKFIEFKNAKGDSSWINPHKVSAVVDRPNKFGGDPGSTIYMDSGEQFHTVDQSDQVIEKITVFESGDDFLDGWFEKESPNTCETEVPKEEEGKNGGVEEQDDSTVDRQLQIAIEP